MSLWSIWGWMAKRTLDGRETPVEEERLLLEAHVPDLGKRRETKKLEWIGPYGYSPRR